MPYSTGLATAAVIQPCTFSIDCEWARAIIDKLSQGLDRIANAVRRGIDMFRRGVERVLSWFPDFLIPSWVKRLINQGLKLLAQVSQKIYQVQSRIMSLLKQLLAPWQIRSAGQNLLDCLVPKTSQFADALQTSNLASSRSWQSDASRDFLHAVQRQHDAAKGAADGAKSFGTGVKQLGDEAVKTTMSFIGSYVGSVIGIVIAAVGLPTVLGTAPAAASIFGLVGKILAGAMALIKTAASIAQQAARFATTAQHSVPGGSWPDDVN